MKKGFTLAEVLITLAIIGVVAALTIPSVIVNTQQSEFKTGLRKAVSVLNQALTMTQALDGITPYDIERCDPLHCVYHTIMHIQGLESGESIWIKPNLATMLSSHMSVMKTTTITNNHSQQTNIAFYTTDGMRFEVPFEGNAHTQCNLKLHETVNGEHPSIPCSILARGEGEEKCGSYGLANNPNGTTTLPCIIMVDVNGDRKPSPKHEFIQLNTATQKYTAYRLGENNSYAIASPEDKKVSDVFTIMITESKAIPFGVVAQKAMYQARDKK